MIISTNENLMFFVEFQPHRLQMASPEPDAGTHILGFTSLIFV